MQVMNDEEGLRGCWFGGRVAQTCGSHALVAYAELEDEDAGGPLREWFPLPGAPAGLPGAPGGAGLRVHTQSGYLLRPAPPPEVHVCSFPVLDKLPPALALTLTAPADGCPSGAASCTLAQPLIP
jgi:hypothetical protein